MLTPYITVTNTTKQITKLKILIYLFKYLISTSIEVILHTKFIFQLLSLLVGCVLSTKLCSSLLSAHIKKPHHILPELCQFHINQ
ncbi:uncharacterized protein DS421_16g541730 [Arachis hypogaea]|nr:uncharacterized protein DS421_16g541730 [Arachis hypogaea]